MKILTTGGAGYLGSVLVPMLLEEGHHVTVLDNFLYRENSLARCCICPQFEVHRVDCRDIEAVRPFLAKADVVIPLAALVGAPICDLNPIDAELLNLFAQLQLIESISPCQFVIMPTTESVYGRNVEVCTEETPLNPLSTYGKHKVEVEEALLSRRNSISLRLATLFGMSPRMRLDLLINDFTWRAASDHSLIVFEGHAKRTCTHVIDAARAFCFMVDRIKYSDRSKSEIYNVGSVTLSKISLCEEIKKQVPDFHYVESKIGTDPDARDYIVSDAKLRALGFSHTVDLPSGITELLKGFRTLGNKRYGNMP